MFKNAAAPTHFALGAVQGSAAWQGGVGGHGAAPRVGVSVDF